MTTFNVKSIGKICNSNEGVYIALDKAYIPALQALEGFSHINVLWWASDFDEPTYREALETKQPYKNAPEVMGIFATRSPVRPNPIAVTVVDVLHIDMEKGMIHIPYIDAHDQTPLLDIKPYTPSIDRIETPSVPKWCSHWPKNVESSGAFDWENELIY
ncbi:MULTISPECIES: SAM-dependent methyltransferase [unclassified Breznakia]|uniref:SAM-dependent methyltransferase n=1 Tax=unclassified Breznakia TaxID=2623764 RepID=UPI002475B79F|nr:MULTISPECIES: SAM-dependent methyltransferase [unclassified Breznakia]MDH6366410.1 tRNA-Thr(GGU) m(6)t(6)A37 methyltransferase TsaA [Breznakia sp. PH1-1]MDH6403503.1 tRNA-Thr(GGU) m(6)t(6)A37 methyltransferase TsaA [Breznakia sp. PF1-11]MDH6411212.1 tRNA-Thr(GGU) m(6)t(6)A37 methyltransferase TsaA [Breznakia sp. PFB1-11]MDH6413525.1 tRNA-Thr(GGU) m(6)t(6)A37 methyltransferase TsaA [Breznakia sp. PFB1-14]MDH6415757.1 tRNA-Thr(GGU) m(6)t(6)A37 methyltransferase TsaA [Breznakia sp. PFB1-4]